MLWCRDLTCSKFTFMLVSTHWQEMENDSPRHFSKSHWQPFRPSSNVCTISHFTTDYNRRCICLLIKKNLSKRWDVRAMRFVARAWLSNIISFKLYARVIISWHQGIMFSWFPIFCYSSTCGYDWWFGDADELIHSNLGILWGETCEIHEMGVMRTTTRSKMS